MIEKGSIHKDERNMINAASIINIGSSLFTTSLLLNNYEHWIIIESLSVIIFIMGVIYLGVSTSQFMWDSVKKENPKMLGI